MYFKKNVRTICSKSRKKPHRGKIAPGVPLKGGKWGAQIWPSYISIDCKFCALSEKYENHIVKINRKFSSGKNSDNWYLCIHHCISRVQYIWILLFCRRLESWCFAFAASGAVFFKSTTKKFLAWFGCFCDGHLYGWSTIPAKLARGWSRFWA